MGKPDITRLYENNMNSLIGRRKYRDRKYRLGTDKKLTEPESWIRDHSGDADT